MLRLASVLFSMVATALAGTGVVVALVAGYVTLVPILIGAGVGVVLAFPATFYVTKAILSRDTPG